MNRPDSSLLEKLSPMVQRFRAPNPGPMTLTGTNSYLIGRPGEEMAVLDPGPQMESHLESLVTTARNSGSPITTILVTHGHPDHFPGAALLKALTGARVGAFRKAEFPHDLNLEDGSEIKVGTATLKAIFTPGHAVDHLCFFLEEEEALFTGDMILGTGTVIVAPPRGDMALYLNSLEILKHHWSRAKVIYGGHGPAVPDPAAKIQEYLTHREVRKLQLLKALEGGASTIPEMVSQIYQDVDKKLWPAAARQVLAYLVMLEARGQVKTTGETLATPEDLNLLNPTGVIDPTAAAELGFGQRTEKIQRYLLLK